MQFDVNRMNRTDQITAVCGALLFICMFLPFYHIGLDGFASASVAGHQSGFLAWGGLWLGFLGGGLAFFPSLGTPWPAQAPVTRTIGKLGVTALATLLLVLRFLIKPGGSEASSFVHRSFGLYFTLIVVIVSLVFSVIGFRESGESLPTKADFSGLTSQFGGGGQQQAPGGYGQAPVPPAPGYAQPGYGEVPPPPTPSWNQPPAAPPAYGQQPAAPAPGYGEVPPPPTPSWNQPPAPDTDPHQS